MGVAKAPVCNLEPKVESQSSGGKSLVALLHDLLAGGWLQNLLIGIVLLLVTPYIGSPMAGRSGTVIGAGVGITILVWIFVWVELRRTHKPPEIPELPKTLHDYFRSDFN